MSHEELKREIENFINWYEHDDKYRIILNKALNFYLENVIDEDVEEEDKRRFLE